MNDRSMRGINLAFRFVLEILALVALFLFGMSLTDSLPIGLVLGVGLVAFVMVVWGAYVAPKATRRLADPVRLAVELVIFFGAVLAFGFAVSWLLAILYGLAVIISLALMFNWGQRGH